MVDVTLSSAVERGAITKLEALRLRATMPCPCCGPGPARPYTYDEWDEVIDRVLAAFPEHTNDEISIDLGG